MTYYLITYGCQMNIADSEKIESLLKEKSFQKVEKIEEADLIIINACSVRQSAIDRIWGRMKKFKELKKKKKDLKFVLTGCVLKEDKKKFSKFFDLILDIKNLNEFPQKIHTLWPEEKEQKEKRYCNLEKTNIKPVSKSKIIAYIPIMRGCNNFCSYCVVPYTRGREISRKPEEIILEVKNYLKKGYKEIWLLGQNVASYPNFSKLLKMVAEIPGKFWIRFTSPHPKDFSDNLIKTMGENKKITPYLNLPVQSGDDEILKKMNRPYSVKQYKNLVRKIYKKIPNITLSTDVIVGFPGEKRKHFLNTLKLFKQLKFDMAYISLYSKRSGTKAALFKDDVPFKEKKEREKILTQLLQKIALAKNKGFIGKTTEVLCYQRKQGFIIGKSKEYKTVKIKSKKNLIGEFVKVKITRALSWGLEGEFL